MASSKFRKTESLRNPFSAIPAPKSFYHPSPYREVDSNQKIVGSEKKADKEKTKLEEDFAGRSKPFKSSEEKTIQYLISKPAQTFETLFDEQIASVSDQFNESWPETEKASASFLTERSGKSEQTFDHNDLANTSRATDEFISNLNSAVINRNNNYSESNQPNNDSASILQRYIDRFRNSEPKSREERNRDRYTKKEDFWWLNSANKNKDASPSKKITKLTKDALLAMDQQTLSLQRRADFLLSKSEQSLASSGPIVSTDGLGSTATTNNSDLDTTVSYKSRSFKQKPSANNPVTYDSYRRERASELKFDSGTRQYPDDILTRWRLRNKMQRPAEDGKIKPEYTHKPKSEMNAKLQEYRQKLLHQKATIISQDVENERRRLDLMFEDQFLSGTLKLKIQEKEPEQDTALTQDPILERLQRVTCDKSNQFLAGEALNENTNNMRKNNFDQTLPEVVKCDESSINKVLNKVSEPDRKHTDQKETQTSLDFEPRELNKNNMAIVQTETATEFAPVDNFKIQVICDPSRDVFLLQDSENTRNKLTTSRSSSWKNGDVKIVQSESELINKKESLQECERNKSTYHQYLEAEKPCDQSDLFHNAGNSQKSRENSIDKHDAKLTITEKSFSDKPERVISVSSSFNSESEFNSQEKNVTKNTNVLSHEDSNEKHYFKGRDRQVQKSKSNSVISSPSIASQDIQSAIGQTVGDHLFDQTSVLSSVDSWASMFPASPAPVHRRDHTDHAGQSHTTPIVNRQNNEVIPPLQSTPLTDDSVLQNAIHSDTEIEDELSDSEFEDDPLLQLLRKQRSDYVLKLEMIDKKLKNVPEA